MCAAVTLEGVLKDLKTDIKEVDIQLAEVYCEKISSEFSKPGTLIRSELDYKFKPALCTELIEKIKENTELICQLEYKARCIKSDEVKSRDIVLIIQNLLYCSSHQPEEQFIDEYIIVFNKTTPLSTLALVAQSTRLVINCDRNSAPICYLFTSLCHEVGFTNVTLKFESEYSNVLDVAKLKCIRAGCVGVVAERSDLDSAVDTFIATSTMNPWKLQRVFIQENVYEEFKRVLEWKMKLEMDNVFLHIDDGLKAQCTGAFICGGKLFLLDYTGVPEHLEDDQRNIILVEAYRTNKELLSLINVRGAYCVSLWASDISEANEIAFEVKAPVVWINDYATFDGPTNASQSFFSVILSEYYSSNILGCNEFNAVVNLHKSWLKLSFDERRKIMLKAFNEIETRGNLDKKITNEIRKNIKRHEAYKEGIVQIKNNKMCICFNKPFEILKLHSLSQLSNITTINAIASVVDGNGIAIDVDIDSLYLLEIFEKEKIPIVHTHLAIYTKIQTSWKAKTIWSNFGTTFAN